MDATMKNFGITTQNVFIHKVSNINITRWVKRLK